MRAYHQRILVGIAIGRGQNAKHIANLVYAHLQIEVVHPLHQGITARTVGIGQRDAAAAAMLRVCAYGTKLLQLLQ